MENIVRQNLNAYNIPEEEQYVQPQQTQDITFGDLGLQPSQEVTNPSIESQVSSPQTNSQDNIDAPDENGNTVDDYLREAGYYGTEEQSKAQERRKQIDNATIFEKLGEGAKWTGETLVNTKDRAIDLATALGYSFIHPIKTVVNPSAEYLNKKLGEAHQAEGSEGLKRLGEIPVDLGSAFITHPLTGKSIPELIKDKYSIEDLAEHIHQGRGVDIALTLPIAGGLIKSAIKPVKEPIAKGLEKIDNAVTGGRITDYNKVKDIKRELRSEQSFEKAQTVSALQDFKKELLNKIKVNKSNINDMTELVDRMLGGDPNKTLLNMPEKLNNLWADLKPVVEKYDDILGDIKARGEIDFVKEPGNLMEIYSQMVYKAKKAGSNITYQFVKDGLQDSGLLDVGLFRNKKTGDIVQEGDMLNALSDSSARTEIPNISDIKFEIPEEGLEVLAQIAKSPEIYGEAKSGLAETLLGSYGLAESGAIHRISQGLAKIDKDGLIPESVRKAKKQGLFSERVYGNADPKDIAWQWVEPENLFQYAIKGQLRDLIVQKWRNEWMRNKMPIVNKRALPEDVRYVRQDTFFNSNKLDNLEKYALKEIPRNQNPEVYIPIDRFTLRAFRELFSPSWMSKKMPLVKDIISLYKQGLLAAGTYLGPNFLGGLYQVLTNSNVHILDDVANAIKTRGELIKQLGSMREMPIKGDIKAATDPNAWYGKAIRKANVINQSTGSYHWRKIDAAIQNTIAEINAHGALRKRKVKFEDRNLAWLMDNMTKMEMYNLINDVEKMSLIYGDETFIAKPILDFMEIGNPFIRWPDQAIMSSTHTLKNNPIFAGYLQGAVLGSLVWDQNEANAKGMGISNPQHGKMYRLDKTGTPKSVSVEVLPQQSSLRALTSLDYLTNSAKNATFAWAMDMIKTKNQYGKLKERSKYPDSISLDYQRNVRIKDGKIVDNVELDELAKTLMRESVLYRGINGTYAPMLYGLAGKQVYQPYNDQFMVGEGGNPNKPIGPGQVLQRLKGEYEHNIIPGIDDTIAPKKEIQFKKNMVKRTAKAKARRSREEAIMQDKGDLK
ncbi:MAG: hypothetical protein J6Y02_13215 [Pseudobutyrivibrio sp.]|nr:hypothetical protein [Pseudobutyrivibrio sp.]